MLASLTEEQALIQGSALDWLAGNYSFIDRQTSVHRDGGSPAAWAAFAELGWLGLTLPEETGGSGLGQVEAGLLMQAFGRHLVVEPFHACVLQAARLLELSGSPAQKQEWLPRVAAAELRLALAHAEPGDVLPWEQRRTIATQVGDGWQIKGTKQLATGAPDADMLIVSARLAAGDSELLFMVDPGHHGVRVEPYDTGDGARAADIHLDAALPAEALLGNGTPEQATDVLHRVLAEGIVAHCWQATGAMQAVLEQTMQYTQQRKQFGQSLSSFQVVQHRLAEMAVLCVEAQACCELAAMRMKSEPAQARNFAAMARSKTARAARFVSQEAVQLHGAMGVCEELPVAATFRMLLAFMQMDGDGASHAEDLGRKVLASGAFNHSQTLGATQ
ncbi:MAG: acyl-CoA dehydrogenase [Pseudomonadota bacterium]